MMTLGEVINLLTAIFTFIFDMFGTYFGGSDEGEADENTDATA